MPRLSFLLPALFLALAAAWPAAADDEHAVLPVGKLAWQPGPDALPPGAQVAVLSGDPAAEGSHYILRARLPDGYVVPPHWHSKAENVTVLSGTFKVGMGDTLAPDKAEALGAGGFFRAPGKMPHFAIFSGETVIEVSGIGPFDITYLNARDDPRNMVGSSK